MSRQPTNDPIDVRVQRSLKRVGFDDISVKDLGDGAVELHGTVSISFDIALANYVASTVPGVIRIAHRLRACNSKRASKGFYQHNGLTSGFSDQSAIDANKS